MTKIIQFKTADEIKAEKEKRERMLYSPITLKLMAILDMHEDVVKLSKRTDLSEIEKNYIGLINKIMRYIKITADESRERDLRKQPTQSRYIPTISVMLTGAEYSLIDIYRSVTDKGKSYIIDEAYDAEKKWGATK